MLKLPVVSSTRIIRALQRVGFSYAPRRGKGSHVALFRIDPSGAKKLVIVPKKKQIPKGTLLAILQQAGIEREEFLKLL